MFLTKIFTLAVSAAVIVAGIAGIIWWQEGRKEISKNMSPQTQQAQVAESQPTTAQSPTTQPTKQEASTKTLQPKTSGAQTTRTIPGKITAYITDQYGNPYGGQLFGYSPETLKILREQYGPKYAPGGLGRIVNYALYDALGTQVQAGYPGIKDGVFETTVLPSGKYTLYVPANTMYETPAVKIFNLPAEGINLGNLTIMEWGMVRVRVTNEVGTPISAHQLLTRCEITDSYVNESDKTKNPSTCASLSNYRVGSNINNNTLGTYPVGNYAVQISSYGYETIEKSFSVNNRDVDLGTITLKKQ